MRSFSDLGGKPGRIANRTWKLEVGSWSRETGVLAGDESIALRNRGAVNELTAHARTDFEKRFLRASEVAASAPGRVNLIGEHVDYNGGVVLPAPLRLGTAVALARRDDGRIRVASREFEGIREVALDAATATSGFAAYPLAAARALLERGVLLGGFELTIASDLPIGAGLSSSASLLVATLRAFDSACGLSLEAKEIAELAFRAETRFIGVSCGRMDPFACAVARPGHALRFDCRDGSLRDVALPLDEIAIVVADSGTRRELSHSAYNERVRECAVALEALRATRAGISSLRDATESDLAAVSRTLDAVVFARATHVVREIARVDEFIGAIERRDYDLAGEALDRSHADLRDRFEVSTPTLDALQRRLRTTPGCFGARLTGAGFGGCLVALVERREADRIARDHGGFTAL